MTTPAQAVVQATGLVHGHCECRFLDETVPVLSHVLALEVIDKRDKQVTMKHPNTGWLLIVHEGGPEARDKPERNHYGVRVSNNNEVDKRTSIYWRIKNGLILRKS
jgi:hypothetical protein